MKKPLLTLIASLCLLGTTLAQPLTCTQPGTILEYGEYDAKGTLTGYTRSTIQECIPTNQGWLRTTTLEQSLDTNRQPVMRTIDKQQIPATGKHTIVVRGKDMVLPVKDLLDDPEMESAGVKLKLTGSEYAIPFDLQPGQILPDLTMEFSAASKTKAIKATITIQERTVLAKEELSTQAGKFTAFKISEKMTVKILLFKISMYQRTWYAPGIGVIREEELSKNGKLQEYTQLLNIQQPL